MEKDIEEIRIKIENFIRRYGVSVQVETENVLRNACTGKIVSAEAHLIITT